MKLHFHGGARIITGANYLLETKNLKILIDCGIFQGERHVEDINYKDFPYDPKTIDYLLITHGHIDHTGRIPKLYKDGFQGKIYSTRPTKDFAYLMLFDSQGILEEEAKREGRKPLYMKEDVEKSLTLMEGVDYGKKIKLGENVFCRFRDAGHILGSAIIEIWAEGKKIVFSGDLGNPPVPLLKSTEIIKEADYLLIESTYGDRIHEDKAIRKDILEDSIENTIARGGVVMIPAFALERTQELLYELNELVENHRIPEVPIFMDSPLAIKATEVYKKYPEYYNKKATYLIESGDDLFNFPGLEFTRRVEESKKINDIPPPKVIIAGSGMSTGGRILHHEIRYLPDPKNLLLIIAYQAVGTLGRKILERAEQVKIFNERVSVRAEVKAIGGYSAHADQKMLLSWIKPMRFNLKKVFVVQGEGGPANALVSKIKDELAIDAKMPKLGAVVDL